MEEEADTGATLTQGVTTTEMEPTMKVATTAIDSLVVDPDPLIAVDDGEGPSIRTSIRERKPSAKALDSIGHNDDARIETEAGGMLSGKRRGQSSTAGPAQVTTSLFLPKPEFLSGHVLARFFGLRNNIW